MLTEVVNLGRALKNVITLLAITLIVSDCYYTYQKSQYRPIDMSEIHIGMTEEKVRETLGPPADVIGSRDYEDGHVVRVLQYMEVEFSWDAPIDRLKKNYYLYFIDDSLSQWGRPGDWQKEADSVYEVRFGATRGDLE